MDDSTIGSNMTRNKPGTAPVQSETVKAASTLVQAQPQNRQEAIHGRLAGMANQGKEPEKEVDVKAAKERKRVDPIALAEAKLKQKEAKLAESRNLLTQRKRKVRNSQLYVWGAMVESAYRQGDTQQRASLRKLAETYLIDERHRERSGFGFSRIDEEIAESKT